VFVGFAVLPEVALLSEPVAIASDGDGVALVQEPLTCAAAVTSSPRTDPQSSKPLLPMSTVEARSQQRIMSWKKSIAPVRQKGTYPISSIMSGDGCVSPVSHFCRLPATLEVRSGYLPER
jgi:hypothetical protein